MKKPLLIVLGLGVFAALVFWVGSRPGEEYVATATPIVEQSELVQINNIRAEAHLPALAEDARLNKAAQLKANDLVARNYFQHHLAGESTWQFLVPQLTTPGTLKYGENLAQCAPNIGSRINSWKNSPAHLANIRGDYTLWGSATAHNPKDNCDYTVNYFLKEN